MAVTKIVRITRHEASEEQLMELKRIFGEVEVAEVSESLPNNPREAVARIDELAMGANVIEAVLPVNLLESVLKFSQFSRGGGKVIRAVMNREEDEEGEVKFIFDHYERVVKVEIITETL